MLLDITPAWAGGKSGQIIPFPDPGGRKFAAPFELFEAWLAERRAYAAAARAAANRPRIPSSLGAAAPGRATDAAIEHALAKLRGCPPGEQDDTMNAVAFELCCIIKGDNGIDEAAIKGQFKDVCRSLLNGKSDKGIWTDRAFESKWRNAYADAVPRNLTNGLGDIVAIYDYTDEAGKLIFQVCRFDPKDFRQRQPNGSGKWIWKVKGLRVVPYRLPEVLAAIAAKRIVFIPEGEKDCNNLAKLGLTASCNAGGAAKSGERPKWNAEHAAFFRGADVVVLPHNDDAGRAHGEAVAKSLQGIAARVRKLELPGLKKGGDVSDWLAMGGDVPRLMELARSAPDWHPAPDNSDSDLFTEKSLAKLFAEENRHRFRHVAIWGKWLEFTGTHWREDDTLFAFDEVGALCERVSLNGEKRSKTLETVKTASAVEKFAKADRRLVAKHDQWDLDPWLLNCPAGVVDLRTGKMRPHRADDYMRMIAGVSPDPCCPIPEWLAFLERISGGDQEWIDYLQRVAGYSLTGDVSLQALFFGYGTGSNGKGVVVKAFSECLGDYHRAAGIETFVETKYERHSTELARLHGCRLVTVPEIPAGKRWDEAKLKTLSGGDRVTARFMRKDDFEYDPQCKLFLSGNNKPGLRGVDEAWRRRFRLIPFTVTIPKDERDPNFFENRIRPELPGILAWMMRGCRDFLDNGEMPPKGVLDATEAYLNDQDAFGAWLDECCDTGSYYLQRRGELFASWRGWSEAANEYTGKKSEFWGRLTDKGFVSDRTNALGEIYRGLRLKPAGALL